LKEEVSKVCF